MYAGNNPKALLTVTLIADAFERELQEKSYARISVKSLCSQAQVSRQAFYNVYGSKEEVLRFCINRVFKKTVERRARRSADGDGVGSHESIRIFVDTFYENRAFMDRIVANHRERELTEGFIFFVTDLLDQEGWTDGAYTGYRLAFYAGGIVEVLIHWLRDENRITEEELIGILDGLNMPFRQL